MWKRCRYSSCLYSPRPFSIRLVFFCVLILKRLWTTSHALKSRTLYCAKWPIKYYNVVVSMWCGNYYMRHMITLHCSSLLIIERYAYVLTNLPLFFIHVYKFNTNALRLHWIYHQVLLHIHATWQHSYSMCRSAQVLTNNSHIIFQVWVPVIHRHVLKRLLYWQTLV